MLFGRDNYIESNITFVNHTEDNAADTFWNMCTGDPFPPQSTNTFPRDACLSIRNSHLSVGPCFGGLTS